MGLKTDRVKKLAAAALCRIQADRALRFINREKLLAVMYHGVTRKQRERAPWTQLPAKVFSEHIEFLARNYRLVSLSELVDYLQTGQDLPERSALITFDDGLRNNLTVAYPILARFGAPAVIFLSTDYIGEERFFWFDELYLMLMEDPAREVIKTLLEGRVGMRFDGVSPDQVYWRAVEHLKRVPQADLVATMKSLSALSELEKDEFSEDFGILKWSEIGELHGSGLVEFGVHTANHRILSGLELSEWETEIQEPRRQLSRALGQEVVAFAYPNGSPEIDYSEVHTSYLEESGYRCAFSTEPRRARLHADHAFEIGRLAIGNDITSEPGFFRLLSSGFPGILGGG